MAKPRYGRFDRPGSLNQVMIGRGANSDLVGFLMPFARQDFVYFEDDFESDTIDGTYWNLGTDATTATAFAAGTLEGGNIQGSTGATDNEAVMVLFARTIWTAGRNCGAEIRFKIDTISSNSVNWEFGFSDPLTDDTLPACDNIDTPTSETDNGQTDYAVIGLDGDATLKTMALITNGGTDAAAKSTLPTGVLLTAAAYSRMLVQCNTRRAQGVVDNDWTNKAATIDTGPDASVLMRPHFFFRTRVATDRIADVDYFRIWSERA